MLFPFAEKKIVAQRNRSELPEDRIQRLRRSWGLRKRLAHSVCAVHGCLIFHSELPVCRVAVDEVPALAFPD